jgi:hypothetical protein
VAAEPVAETVAETVTETVREVREEQTAFNWVAEPAVAETPAPVVEAPVVEEAKAAAQWLKPLHLLQRQSLKHRSKRLWWPKSLLQWLKPRRSAP